METLLSPARMAPYVSTVAHDWNKALALYDWNTCIGAAFFESIHYLEVGLRNAMDNSAVERLGRSWLTPLVNGG